IHVHLTEDVWKAREAALGSYDIMFDTPYLDPVGTFFASRGMSDMLVKGCKLTLEKSELIEQLKREEYDVMMAENFDMCGIG
ncbi:hypothetical protein PFISCL1PPCAC_13657, partial [Pristionchus fissidentatus]